MKPWKTYFKDIGQFFLARKPAEVTTKSAITNGPWFTTRVSAVQDFLRLNDLKKELAVLDYDMRQNQRTLSAAVTSSRTGASQKVLSDTLQQVKGNITQAKAQIAQLNKTIAQAEVYAVEGSLAYRRNAQLKSALQTLLADKTKRNLLYAAQPDIQSVYEEIKNSQPDLAATNEREPLKSFLESILPFKNDDPLANLPTYESPNTYYNARKFVATAPTRRTSTAMESFKGTRRTSTAVVALSPSENKEDKDTVLSARRPSVASTMDSEDTIPMPTFVNTIGLNVIRHPLITASYALDAFSKIAFEYPAQGICKAVNAAYNGLYRLGGWIANRFRAMKKEAPVAYDPYNSTTLQRLKVATNTLLIIPPLLLATRTVCLGAAKAVGSEGGLRDNQFSYLEKRHQIQEDRRQDYETEIKRRRSTRGSLALARANSSPNLLKGVNSTNDQPPEERKQVFPPGTVEQFDDVEMLSSDDSAKQLFVRTDTISPLTRADSDANRFNTFSPRASGDTSFIKHLLINTGDEITPNPCMTPGSQQGNLTMRSNLVSSLGGSLTSSPQVTPLAVAHPRFQTWVTPDKDATPQPSPQPSPKPDNATDRTQRLAITRAKTIGLLTPPASARKPRLDRIKTGQVYRIDEGNNNSPESSAKTPKK